MKYTREQRLDIGREIYTGVITYVQASEKYDLRICTLKEYVRLYRETNKLPRMKPGRESAMFKSSEPNTLEEYESMYEVVCGIIFTLGIIVAALPRNLSVSVLSEI